MRAEVGEDFTGVGAGSETIQCGAEHRDSVRLPTSKSGV